jgi:hypothetical protein
MKNMAQAPTRTTEVVGVFMVLERLARRGDRSKKNLPGNPVRIRHRGMEEAGAAAGLATAFGPESAAAFFSSSMSRVMSSAMRAWAGPLRALPTTFSMRKYHNRARLDPVRQVVAQHLVETPRTKRVTERR